MGPKRRLVLHEADEAWIVVVIVVVFETTLIVAPGLARAHGERQTWGDPCWQAGYDVPERKLTTIYMNPIRHLAASASVVWSLRRFDFLGCYIRKLSGHFWYLCIGIMFHDFQPIESRIP